MLRVVFFGTPEFAVPTLRALLDAGQAVVGVITQPDRPSGRGQRLVEPPVKQLAREHGVPAWQPERLKDPAFLDVMRDLRPDLGVVAAYGKLLPESLLAIPPLGLLNVHASLLPRWRGASPVHHAVMAGDQETGVTIMRVVKALDAGPMLARRVRPIRAEETSVEIERDLAVLGASLLLEVLDGLERGAVVEEPQDDALSTYAPRLTKEDGLIDWGQPADRLRDRVRGLQPWPLAHSWLGPTRIAVLRARAEPRRPVDETAAPGTVVEVEPERIAVAAGAGTALVILLLQPAGRRAMTARAFLAGHRLAPGVAFAQAPSA